MPECVENRMLIDSEWEDIELLQMRTPDRRGRRMKRVMDEMEYGRMVEEDE